MDTKSGSAQAALTSIHPPTKSPASPIARPPGTPSNRSGLLVTRTPQIPPSRFRPFFFYLAPAPFQRNAGRTPRDLTLGIPDIRNIRTPDSKWDVNDLHTQAQAFDQTPVRTRAGMEGFGGLTNAECAFSLSLSLSLSLFFLHSTYIPR